MNRPQSALKSRLTAMLFRLDGLDNAAAIRADQFVPSYSLQQPEHGHPDSDSSEHVLSVPCDAKGDEIGHQPGVPWTKRDRPSAEDRSGATSAARTTAGTNDMIRSSVGGRLPMVSIPRRDDARSQRRGDSHRQ